MTFRYHASGNWFKGNVHVHSTVSDGGKTFAELAELYASAGYDFLFRTDHWACSDVAADREDYPLLWLDGIELNGLDHTGADYHVVCLGRVAGLDREAGLEAGLQEARRQGAMLILAHPHWCGNSLEDVLRWDFDGVEVYNHVCHWLNGKSGGLVHWDAALMQKPGTLALAVDDTHLRLPEHPGWNGGWIVVNAPRCTAEGIMEAIRGGNFYSSQGPELYSLNFDGQRLQVQMSPVRFARLVGPGSHGRQAGFFEAGKLMDKVSFTVPPEWAFVYLEVEDDHGRRAWTNPLFS